MNHARVPAHTSLFMHAVTRARLAVQDSSKGGAVETGCGDLYAVVYDFTI